MVPIGVGVHLAPCIAACEKVLTEAGLKIQLHPNGTAIEAEWEPVFAAIEACHQAVDAKRRLIASHLLPEGHLLALALQTLRLRVHSSTASSR